MSTDKTPDTPAPPGDAAADRNLERLLTVAYKPDVPSDDFARRLSETVQQRAARQPVGARFTLRAVIAWSALSAAAAAAVIAMVVSAKALSDKTTRPPQVHIMPRPSPATAPQQNDEQGKLARELAAKCVELETKHAELAARFAALQTDRAARETQIKDEFNKKEQLNIRQWQERCAAAEKQYNEAREECRALRESNRVLSATVTQLTERLALVPKPTPAPRPEQAVASLNEDGPKVRPIVIQLPKPLFEGTPKALKGIVLAKPRGLSEQFLAPAGCWNIALNKPVTSSDPEPTVGNLKQVTDSDKEAVEGSYIELGPGVQWVQIDLQAVYAIHYVLLWHFHKEARVYRDVVVQVADDADFITNVRTVFNNDSDNSSGLGVGQDMEYLDEYLGKLIDAKGVKARYVRCYSKGNTSNDQNHYTEVEVFGVPAKQP